MSRSMVSAVVFDLDGTLIDSTEAIIESFQHTFDTLKQPHAQRQAILDGIGALIADQFESLCPDCDPQQCVQIFRAYYPTVCLEKTCLLPDARDLLQTLAAAGIRMGFASSKKLAFSEMILDHHGLLDYFESRLGPEEVRQAKPHPEAVLRALADLNAAPPETYFVGDTHFDVLAARAAGVRCLCVTTGYATREQLEALGPEAVYDRLDEVGRHILADTRGSARDSC